VYHLVLGEFSCPAGEFEEDTVGVTEVERAAVHAGVQFLCHLGLAVGVIADRPDADPFGLEPLVVLVELFRRHIEGDVVERADGRVPLRHIRLLFARRRIEVAGPAVGPVGQPEDRQRGAVADVENELLPATGPFGQVHRLDQGHPQDVAIELDGALHVVAHQRHMIEPAEAEFIVCPPGHDHLRLLSVTEAHSSLNCRALMAHRQADEMCCGATDGARHAAILLVTAPVGGTFP
jgi:hypothetical protein